LPKARHDMAQPGRPRKDKGANPHSDWRIRVLQDGGAGGN
jgi:hypothetical protein